MPHHLKQIALIAPIVLAGVCVVAYRGGSLVDVSAVYVGAFLAWWTNR